MKKKIVVSIEPNDWPDDGLFYATIGEGGDFLGRDYTTIWSAKRGVRRFMKALGAANWRFEDEPDSEPAVKGVHSWARWEAMDADGSVWEYEFEPMKLSTIFSRRKGAGRYQCVRWCEYSNDWRKTLRRVNT